MIKITPQQSVCYCFVTFCFTLLANLFFTGYLSLTLFKSTLFMFFLGLGMCAWSYRVYKDDDNTNKEKDMYVDYEESPLVKRKYTPPSSTPTESSMKSVEIPIHVERQSGVIDSTNMMNDALSPSNDVFYSVLNT